jgi:hypothetical protein
MDELDRDRGAQHAGAIAVRRRTRGHEHEQRSQPLAPRRDRRAGVLGEHRPVRGRDLREAQLEAIEQLRDVRAARFDDRCHGLRGRHQRTVPECRAMIPPAVRIQRTSVRPARSSAPASASGPGKRFTDFGR